MNESEELKKLRSHHEGVMRSLTTLQNKLDDALQLLKDKDILHENNMKELRQQLEEARKELAFEKMPEAARIKKEHEDELKALTEKHKQVMMSMVE